MTEERQAAGARPSKLAITKLLAEVEARRQRAVRYSLVGLLLPLAVGAALLFYIVLSVAQKLEEKKKLDGQIEAARIEVAALGKKKAELEAQMATIAATLNEVKATVSDAADKGESAKAVEARIQNAIASNPNVAAATPHFSMKLQDGVQRTPEWRVAVHALENAGFAYSGGAEILLSVPASEVRYFRPEDRRIAEKAIVALKILKRPFGAPRLLKTGEAEPGQIEVLLALLPPKQAGESGAPSTPEGLTKFLYAQLSNDARARVLQAGDTWRQLPLGYFYPDETSVDIAVKSTMLRELGSQDKRLPDFLWITLASGINKDTRVSDAITIMAQVAAGATR